MEPQTDTLGADSQVETLAKTMVKFVAVGGEDNFACFVEEMEALSPGVVEQARGKFINGYNYAVGLACEIAGFDVGKTEDRKQRVLTALDARKPVTPPVGKTKTGSIARVGLGSGNGA